MTAGFDFDDLDRAFFAECEEYLRSADSVLRLENPDSSGQEGLDVLGRCAHSIKGASLILGFSGLGALANALDACLASVREGRARADWTLVREGFAALRDNLAGLRSGGVRSLGGAADLVRSLESCASLDAPASRTLVFRLAAHVAATPVLFDDMLDTLRDHAEVTVLEAPWDLRERTCRLQACSMSADQVLIDIVERVAEPGSVSVEQEGCPGGTGSGPRIDAAPLAASGPTCCTACVTFSLGDRRFAANAPGVDEIRIGGTLHPAVTGSDWVCGTIERDGVFVPVIDLGRCFRLAENQNRPSGMQLISHVAGETVAVLVEDVEEVLQIEPGAIQAFSAVIARDLPKGMLGVLKREGEPLWVVDLPLLLEACIEARNAQ